jgi:KDO2-lipid IV(A) lauroyltransferase
MRRATRANARRLLGDQSTPAARTRMGKAVVANVYEFITELGRHRRSTWRDMLGEVEAVEGHEKYFKARASHRGAIIAAAHLGSFEIAVAALRQYEEKIHVVFKRDRMAALESLRKNLHERLGVVESPVDESDPIGPWSRLRDALQRDEVVLMQADRVTPGQRGVPIPFLGGHIEAPPGPTKLALACGNPPPIIPVFSIWQPDGRIRVIVEDPIEVTQPWTREQAHPSLVQLMTVIESYVKRYPEQWLVTLPALIEDMEQV